MRLLFELDLKNYADCTHTFRRDSARSIIIRDGKVAMVHSLQYGYYEFPGGGIEPGETPIDAMIRETAEEAGLVVVPASVRPFGYVHRIQRSDRDATECFVQGNYYYLCDAENEPVPRCLDERETEERFTPAFVDPLVAIRKNRTLSAAFPIPFERDARVLELLIAEGSFDRSGSNR